MKEYIILTDTCSELDSKALAELKADTVHMHLFIDDKDILADNDWQQFSVKEFYDLVRSGKRCTTSQADEAQFEVKFRKAAEEGKGIMYIACSSALTSSHKEALRAREAVLKDFPEAEIYCVDSLNACYSLGMLVKKACELRDQGLSLEENAKWVEANKMRYNESGTVDNLTYLKRAGRVNGMAAFFGGLLAIKPIIALNTLGQNNAFEKVKGRPAAFKRSAEIIAQYIDLELSDDIYVCHADCGDEVEEFINIIKAALGERKANFHISFIDPIIGISVGPGTFIIDFAAKEELRNVQ